MKEIQKKITKLRMSGMKRRDIMRKLEISIHTFKYYTIPNYRNKLMIKNNERQRKKRVERMELLRNELGGKCQMCGYNKCFYALHFHHKDPLQKEFHISQWAGRYSLEKLRNEVKKCILLCANCHIELTHPNKIKLSGSLTGTPNEFSN